MGEQRTRVRPARCELPLAEALEPRLLLSTVVAEAAPPPEPVEGATEAPTMIVGTDEAELIVGTDGNDMILAMGGDDLVKAGDGMDIVQGGTGDDQLRGEGGIDILDGGTGDDILLGGDGTDMLFGNAGEDIVRGGDGDDLVSDGAGEDRINGGDGFDVLVDDTVDVVDATKEGGIRDIEAVLTQSGDDVVTVDLREILRNDGWNEDLTEEEPIVVEHVFVALLGIGDDQDTLIIDATGKWEGFETGDVVKNGDGRLAIDTSWQPSDLSAVVAVDNPFAIPALEAEAAGGFIVLQFTAAGGSMDGEVVTIVTNAETVQVGTNDQGEPLTYTVNLVNDTLTLVE